MPLNPQRLKERRREMGFSQRGLAKAAGLNYATYENMERGLVKDPKHSVLKAIAGVLERDPDYFFDFSAVNNQVAS